MSREIKIETGLVNRKENEGSLILTLDSDNYLKVGDARIYLTGIYGTKTKPQVRILILADKSIPVTRGIKEK